MFNSTGYSLADIAAATGGGNGGRSGGFGDGFMDNGAWWIIILFLFAAMNGNGLWGGGGGGQGGSTIREEISYGFDMNGLENGIRGIQQGLCDGFYAQNTSLLNGFNTLGNQVTTGTAAIQNTLCQGFNGVNVGMLTGFNGIQAQMANDALVAQQCCCETQNLINSKFCDLNYNLATQSCDTRRAIADSTRDIIDNNNAGIRSILDFLTQDKIATLTAENQSLKFAASQAAQNAFITANQEAQTAELIRRLDTPCPVPAYVVPNPNCCYGNAYNFGNRSGCGCDIYGG